MLAKAHGLGTFTCAHLEHFPPLGVAIGNQTTWPDDGLGQQVYRSSGQKALAGPPQMSPDAAPGRVAIVRTSWLAHCLPRSLIRR